MKLSWDGVREVGTSIEKMWERLLDPNVIAKAAGSSDGATPLAGRRYSVTVKVGIGPFKLPVTMEVEMYDLEPPGRGKMRMLGTGPGTGLEGNSTIRLEPLGAERTKLSWSAETTVQGRLAEFGATLLEPLIRKTIDDFWDDMAKGATA